MEEHDYDRCMALAERCLTLMRDHRTPPVPRNYELFYSFVAGRNPELNSAVQERLRTRDQLGPEDVRQLYDTFIAPEQADSKVESIGADLKAEITQILQLVHSATDTTEAFGERLKRAGDQLDQIDDPAQFQSVVQSLVETTRKMAEDSQELKNRLADSKKQISDLQGNLERMRLESFTDTLTNVANRKRFDLALDQLMKEAARTETPLALMLIDIDHFKQFNDHFGHQTGDGVLKLVARAMQALVKGRDVVARYGGEEFAIIMPKTPLKAAMTVAEQIRRNVMGKELVRKSTGQSLGRVTLSIGVASYKEGELAQTFIHRADAALYAAKHAGRNCVKSERTVTLRDGLDAA